MYEDLCTKFKDILKRIINRINEFIDKNINTPYLIESKLLLINNYIIDILNANDVSQSSFIYSPNQDSSQSNFHFEKIKFNPLIGSQDYEEKQKIINKFKHKYFNSIKEKNEKIIHSYNDFNINSDNKIELTPNKFKIIKLKRKLKDEHEKNKLKELSYLQRLLDMQKDLYLYELKRNKENERNHSYNNNLNYFTINNYYYNNKRNINNINYNENLNTNNNKEIKHSMSQCDFKERSEIVKKNNFDDMKLKYELLRKKKILKRNSFIKFDFGEIKKSIDKKMDKIKGININFPLTIRKTKINKY